MRKKTFIVILVCHFSVLGYAQQKKTETFRGGDPFKYVNFSRYTCQGLLRLGDDVKMVEITPGQFLPKSKKTGEFLDVLNDLPFQTHGKPVIQKMGWMYVASPYPDVKEYFGDRFLVYNEDKTDHFLKPVDISSYKKELIYSNDFNLPAKVIREKDLAKDDLLRKQQIERNDFVFDGHGNLEVVKGRLLLKCGPGNQVFWLTKELPDNFIAEFTYEPKNPTKGWAILFFNYRGVDGAGIFEKNRPLRDGRFRSYHSGIYQGYHISYFMDSGIRPYAYLNKNPYKMLMSGGLWMCGKGENKLMVIKYNNYIQMIQNGLLVIDFYDDGVSYGPVFPGGQFGFRNMGHTTYMYYDNMKFWKITEGPEIRQNRRALTSGLKYYTPKRLNNVNYHSLNYRKNPGDWEFSPAEPENPWWNYQLANKPWSKSKRQEPEDNWQTGKLPGGDVKNVWIRKEFVLKQRPESPHILIHSKGKAKVYLNGVELFDFKGGEQTHIFKLNEFQELIIRRYYDKSDISSFRPMSNMLSAELQGFDADGFLLTLVDVRECPYH